MNSKCPSGKRSYYTQEDAEQGLMGARISFHDNGHNGPINVYQCNDCREWHLTSQGPIHEMLKSNETLKKIELERVSREWEKRLK